MFQDAKELQSEVFLLEQIREFFRMQSVEPLERVDEGFKLFEVYLFDVCRQIQHDSKKLELSVDESDLLVVASGFDPFDVESVDLVFRDVHQNKLLVITQWLLR